MRSALNETKTFREWLSEPLVMAIVSGVLVSAIGTLILLLLA